jgi:Leucine-rich repeat (LRR) protein
MSQMRMLLMSDNNIGDEGVAAIAANPTLGKLHSLGLSHNRITDQGVRLILDSPHLISLKNLDIQENTISPAILRECETRYEMFVRDEVR